MPGKLKVTLVKSPVSHTQRTRATMRALGLSRIGQSIEINDTPEMRGMTRAIRFLLRTEPVESTAGASAKPAKPESSAPAKVADTAPAKAPRAKAATKEESE